MSLYVVEDEDCNLLTPHGYFTDEVALAALYDEPIEPQRDANDYGGHVVELVEKPDPVEVTKHEADLLGAMAGGSASAAQELFAKGNGEDIKRYWHAIQNHWQSKPKRYYVKVPYVQAQDGLWFCINAKDRLGATYNRDLADQFTQAEIDEKGLQNCEKVEATDND